MCSKKCCRMPTLVILGVIITIVLVCITGITLTNSINISNIVKLREKVASDSAAASGANAAQTRAALVEQQYSTLQQHHLSRSDLNYIAATHPKNLQRFAGAGGAATPVATHAQTSPNKIIIEIGIRNFSDISTVVGSANTSDSADANSASSLNVAIEKVVLPINGAILDGNVDSISIPAAAPPSSLSTTQQLNESLSRIPKSTRAQNEIINTPKITTTTTSATDSMPALVSSPATTPLAVIPPMGIADHNPGMIDFQKRSHVKKEFQLYSLKPYSVSENIS